MNKTKTKKVNKAMEQENNNTRYLYLLECTKDFGPHRKGDVVWSYRKRAGWKAVMKVPKYN